MPKLPQIKGDRLVNALGKAGCYIDRLIVEILGDDMVLLMRCPADWTDAFAGRLTHVFGTHEETASAWIKNAITGTSRTMYDGCHTGGNNPQITQIT